MDTVPSLEFPWRTRELCHRVIPVENGEPSRAGIETSPPPMDPIQSSDQPLILDLGHFSDGQRHGVTRAMSLLHAEAVAFCFSDAGHPHPVNYRWVGSRNRQSVVELEEPRPGTSCACDPKVATEWAACGLAILMVENRGHAILEKSYGPGGFEYWIGTPGSTGGLFQDKSRLEVSGIRTGDPHKRLASLCSRIHQVNLLGHNTLPAVIVIVELASPTALIYER